MSDDLAAATEKQLLKSYISDNTTYEQTEPSNGAHVANVNSGAAAPPADSEPIDDDATPMADDPSKTRNTSDGKGRSEVLDFKDKAAVPHTGTDNTISSGDNRQSDSSAASNGTSSGAIDSAVNKGKQSATDKSAKTSANKSNATTSSDKKSSTKKNTEQKKKKEKNNSSSSSSSESPSEETKSKKKKSSKKKTVKMSPATLNIKGTVISYMDTPAAAIAPKRGAGLWLGSDSTTDRSWGYFIGHNPGDFTIVMSLSKGDLVSVCDRWGDMRDYVVTDHMRVKDTTLWVDIENRVAHSGESIILQTCWGDNASYRVVVAKAV